MKRLVILFTLLLMSACSSIQRDTQSTAVPTAANCDGVPATERLYCTSKLLKRMEVILNDGGILVDQRKIESDSTCSRMEQVWHYGQSLPEDQRMIRIHQFSTCSGSVWERIKDQIVFGGLAFGAGFVTGIAVMAGQ